MKSIMMSFLFLILALGTLHADGYYYEGRGVSEDSDWGEDVPP